MYYQNRSPHNQPVGVKCKCPTAPSSIYPRRQNCEVGMGALLPPYVIDAIIYSALFALTSLGVTLIYQTSKVPNFAHGSIVTLGIYIAFSLNVLWNVTPYFSAPVSFVICGLVYVLMYWVVLKPLTQRGAPTFFLIVATFAVGVAFTGIFGAYTDYLVNSFRIANAKYFVLISTDFSFLGQKGLLYLAPSTLAAVCLVMYVFLTKTRLGVGMRAASENPRLAEILGINVVAVTSVAWFIAGGLAGLAGSYFVMELPGTPGVGTNLILGMFAGSILGGLGSLFGAVIGGVIVGGSEIVLTYLLATAFGSWVNAYSVGIPMLLMVIILLIAPSGITSIHWRKLRRSRITKGRGLN